MRLVVTLAFTCAILLSASARSYDIGLVPLHEFADQEDETYGHSISLQASESQVLRMRRWIAQIAATPKGLQTLQAIDEENEFRRQQAQFAQTAFAQRVFVNGEPICP